MVILILCSFVLSSNVSSQNKSLVSLRDNVLMIYAEGVAYLGSGMNEEDARKFALNDAKRNAIEQAGTYIEARTTVTNHKLTKDEVITFSAGLVTVKTVKDFRKLVNNMFAYGVCIEATIDMRLLGDRIKKLQNDSILRDQLIAEREKVKNLETKISELQKSSSLASKSNVSDVVRELTAVEWLEKSYTTDDSKIKFEYVCIALSLNPQYAEAYLLRAIIYDLWENIEESIKDYSKTIEILSKTNRQVGGMVYFLRGMAYYDMGKFEQAIDDFIKISESIPDHSVAYSMCGHAYFQLNKYDEAIRKYTMAIEIDPLLYESYCGRGLAYAHQNNYGFAIRDINKGIQINPQYSDGYKNRAGVYLRMKDLNRAVNDLNTYLRIDNNKSGDAKEIRKMIRELGFSPKY